MPGRYDSHSYRRASCQNCQEMIHLYHAIVWICITIMVHDIVTNAANILNTLFVERIKAHIAELEARRLEAQADIIKDRERRKLEWRHVD